jgi:ankyrin repeat protein
MEIVKFLNRNCADLDAADALGRTALHFATVNGNLDIVKLLIEGKANLFAKTNKDETCLHVASKNGRSNIIDFLSGHNISKIVDEKSLGQTSLHLATQKSNLECVKSLLNLGADKEVKNNQGKTPLHIAAESGLSKIAELLMGKRANKLNDKTCKY